MAHGGGGLTLAVIGPVSMVRDDEFVYRMVVYGRKYYDVDLTSGRVVRISTQAFNDATGKPSVDRAELCDCGPQKTQRDDKNAVLQLLVGDIRALPPEPEQKTLENVVVHHLTVDPDPLPENLAHAQIVPIPSYRKEPPPGRLWNRIQDALSRLALARGTWAISPFECRQDQQKSD